MGALSRSRIQRVCEECGKVIFPGDLYLSRYTTRYKIRCEECYLKSRSKWEEDKESHSDTINQLIDLLSKEKVSKSKMIELYGQRYLGLIRELKRENINIVDDFDNETKELVYYIEQNHNSFDSVDVEELYDLFDEVMIRHCVEELLVKNGFEVQKEHVKFGNQSGRLVIDNYPPETEYESDYHVLLLKGSITGGFGEARNSLVEKENLSRLPEVILLKKLAEEFL